MGRGDLKLLIRQEAEHRRELKAEVRECIITHIHNNRNGCDVDVRDAVNNMPSWQRALRSRKNNLGLKCPDN